jgi:hypothetical protein
MSQRELFAALAHQAGTAAPRVRALPAWQLPAARMVIPCRGGVATLAAAGGTSQATIATGCRQCGQRGMAVRVPRAWSPRPSSARASWFPAEAAAEGGCGLAPAAVPPASPAAGAADPLAGCVRQDRLKRAVQAAGHRPGSRRLKE